MTAVADSSPLVILSKLGCLDFLNRVFPRVYISNEVHYEVVIAGAGLPGASEVSKVDSESGRSAFNAAKIRPRSRRNEHILLAKQLGATPILLDDYRPLQAGESRRP